MTSRTPAIAGPLLLLSAALLAAADSSTTLRYVRHDGKMLVLESEITETYSASENSFVSRTVRANSATVLRIVHDKAGKLTKVEVITESREGKRTAVATLEDGGVRIRRDGGLTDFLKIDSSDPIATTAPDWSDIIQLVRRYDRGKGGPQEFPGLWLHTAQAPLKPIFKIEKVGEDLIAVKDGKLPLERYRIRLRSGDYITWADSAKRVYKLYPAGNPNAAVVLEGMFEETRHLKER